MENVHPSGVTSNSYLFDMSPTEEVNNDDPPLPERPLKIIARIYIHPHILTIYRSMQTYPDHSKFKSQEDR